MYVAIYIESRTIYLIGLKSFVSEIYAGKPTQRRLQAEYGNNIEDEVVQRN